VVEEHPRSSVPSRHVVALGSSATVAPPHQQFWEGTGQADAALSPSFRNADIYILHPLKASTLYSTHAMIAGRTDGLKARRSHRSPESRVSGVFSGHLIVST